MMKNCQGKIRIKTLTGVSNAIMNSGWRKSLILLVVVMAALILFPGTAQADVVTYQKGDGKGTTSETDDSSIRSGYAWMGDTATLDVDSSGHYHSVIKFPNIFGAGANQIPLGSTINSATLTLEVYNLGDTVNLYQLIESWDETDVTWTARTSTLNWTDAGADGTSSRYATAVGSFSPSSTGTYNVTVTATVQNWSGGEANEGWVLTDTGSDGVDIRSSEYGTAADRPKLTVDYTPAGGNTTTIGDGTSPASKTAAQSSTNNAVSAFTLSTDTGTDTVTALTVTFSGTTSADVDTSGVKIYDDSTGGTPNEWDAGDTLKGTGSFSGNDASVTVSISVDSTPTQYLVTYDIASGATVNNTLQGAITAATLNNTLVNNDTVDATLTVTGDGTSVELAGSWVTGTTHTAEAGSDRVLILVGTIAGYNDADCTISSASYGGQPLTFIESRASSGDYDSVTEVYYLNEAGIAAASGSTFSVTWLNNPTGIRYMSGFYRFVNQTTPIGAQAENFANAATPNPITTSALSNSSGDMVIVAAGGNGLGSYTALNGFTEQQEDSWDGGAPDLLTHTVADKAATGSDETPSIQHTSMLSQQIIGFVLQVDPATTTIGDGTSPASKDAAQSSTNNAVSAFTLSTDKGNDTVDALTVTFSGTAVADVATNGVKIYDDSTGGTPNEWDAGDTLKGTGSFSGLTASVTVSISVDTSATQYLVTYDIASGATATNTLQGAITAATVSNTLVNSDTTDATLTVSSAGILFRNQSSDATGGSALSLQVNKPTGCVDGDLLVAIFVADDPTTTLSAPDGTWIPFALPGTETNMVTRAWWKQASSEGATYTFSSTNSSPLSLIIGCFYNDSDSGDWAIEDDSCVTDQYTNPLSTASVTGVANCLMIAAWGGDGGEDTVTTPPSNMTIIGSQQIAFPTTGSHAVAYYEMRDAGAVTKSCTFSGTDDTTAVAGIFSWASRTTTIGDGASPASKNVTAGSTKNAVDAFTLVTSSGADTVTELTVTFTGTDVNDVAASGVKIYDDSTGGTPNEWDAADTLKGTASFSGTTATVSVSISVDNSATQYLVTYNIATGATVTNTLQGAITAATVTNTLVNNDTTDATLTICECDTTPTVYDTAISTTYNVPAGCDQLTIKAWGAGGGGGGAGGTQGGGTNKTGGAAAGGGFAQGTISVTSEETLTIRVGGGGGGGLGLGDDPQGYEGEGGGGGGYTGVLRSGTELIIAGGGGGGGGADNTETPAAAGGAGGGTTGTDGVDYSTITGGGGGTPSAGGAKGVGTAAQNDGSAGSSLLGGSGGDGNNTPSAGGTAGTNGGGIGGGASYSELRPGGGGGGGGHFGGGGGGGVGAADLAGAGGGGGSSYTTGTSTQNTSGSGTSVGNNTEADTYAAGAGTGGSGGTVKGTAGTDGNDGLLVIIPGNCVFSYRKKITIQSSQVIGSADHENFPMLVSLSGDWLKTTTADPTNGRIENASGYDIIFKDSGGTQLDHEIEDYDGSVSGGTLVAWVRIPALDYNDDTVIYMYYGNPCIDSSTENVAGVWNTNYLAVWHLADLNDSTSNNAVLTNSGATLSSSGKMASAYSFGGDGDFLLDDDGESYINGLTAFTVSAWVKSNVIATDNGIFQAGDPDGGDSNNISLRYDDAGVSGSGDDVIKTGILATSGGTSDESAALVQTTAWQHIAFEWSSGNSTTLYLDGQPDTPTWQDTGETGSIAGATKVKIGVGPKDDAGTTGWNGLIDEVRISNTLRLADWFETEYNNQKENSTFYLVGDEDDLGNCSYSYYRPITIESDEVWGSSDHTDFPFLVNISGNWLKTTTSDSTNGRIENDPDGYDIIFRDSYGRQLDHEIEKYDGSVSGGTLIAWVRIPTLSLSVDTVIYMYYGNSCIGTSQENAAGVWNTNFVGVWHLKEEQSGSTADDLYQDSTSKNNHGDDRTDATAQNGRINGGQQFGGDADGDSVQVPHHSTLNLTGDMTISFWFYATENSGNFNRIVDKGYGTSYYFGGGAGTNDITFYLSNTEVFDTADSTFTINAWHYAAVTYDSTSGDATLILDGTESGPWNYTGGITGNTDTVYISHSNATYDFAGYLDEVRISDTDRSAGWLKTCYYNQKENSTFYSINPEEEYAPTAVDLISFTATGQSSTVLVEWETAQEIDNLGFNLYRTSDPGGSYTKLNSSLMPGLISSVKGRKYTHIDTGVTRDVLYYYMLEDVDLSGTRTMHGPICVDWDGDGIPDDDDEQTDDGSDEDTDDSPEVSIPTLRFEEVDFGPEGWTPAGSNASWVKLTSFKAHEQDGGIALEWETSYEIGNLGFHIYRELDGKFLRITPDLVPGSVFSVGEGSELPAGQSYVYWDGLTNQTGRESYWLDSTDLSGGRASFGPIRPEIGGQPVSKRLEGRFRSIGRRQVSRARELGNIRALREELSTKLAKAAKTQIISVQAVPEKASKPRFLPKDEQWALAAQSGVKIYIKEDGWYRVGREELVVAGLNPEVDPRYLQLYADGEEQCLLVTGSEDGRFDPLEVIEFYGTGLDTPYTDAHVYWLVVGSRPGRRFDTPFNDIRLGPDKKMRIPRGLRGRGAPLSFPFPVELKERTFYFAALTDGEGENFFGSVISTEPVDQLLTVAHPDLSFPEDAALEVVLQGATDASHQIKIMLNYVEVGDVVFSGKEPWRAEIQIPQDLLSAGDNIVTLEAQGGSMDVSLVDYIRMTYRRTYTADEDFLRFRARGGEWLAVGGFSSSEIQVKDISDPLRMLNVRGKVRNDGSGYAITFKVPMAGERTLLAFAEEKVKAPAGIETNLASSWHVLGGRGAEFVIIAHRDLLEAVGFLKELREQQGWSVVLVDVEDLYDEFSFGVKSPWAVKEFLARAYDYWTPQPRFVLFVGDSSYDPCNYMGFGDFDLVPTRFVDTEHITTASDDWFVDFDKDGFPEMAVGRLPVESAEEAETVVSKIIAFEGVASLMNEALLVADINDFTNFERASADVGALLQGNITVSEILRGQSQTARADLLSLLNQGQLLVNYVGHGSTKTWNGNLFTSLDAWSLTNSPYLPFLVSMTCLNGFFQDPSIDSMAETFLKAEQGGAVAVWTSSGLTLPGEQAAMNKELIKLLFNGQGLTIGEAIMGAKQAATNRDVRRTWILFGDPTLRLR